MVKVLLSNVYVTLLNPSERKKEYQEVGKIVARDNDQSQNFHLNALIETNINFLPNVIRTLAPQTLVCIAVTLRLPTRIFRHKKKLSDWQGTSV